MTPLCTLDFVNNLCLDEAHTVLLDQGFSSVAALQEGFSREVRFSSVFAQLTDTQDRLCHLYHMEVILSQAASDLWLDWTLSVIFQCSFIRTSELI